MNSSAHTPQLPMWIFFAADAVLLGTASFIAATSPKPLPASAMLWVVALVFAGVMVALLPLLVRYERQRSEQLDERQRALESLAATVSSSAEQLGIAAAGLHQIVELAQKNLRQAEQLPHKLQDKIAEFQAQLSSANDAEREELEKQVADLRTSETERLESISDKLAKTAAELARCEASTRRHLTAANDAIAKLTVATASAPESPPDASPDAAPAHAEAESTLPTEAAEPAAKRPRKTRRDDAPETLPATAAIAAEPAATNPIAVPEPPPIPASGIPEITPVAPATAEPFAGRIATIPPTQPASSAPTSPPAGPPTRDHGPAETVGLPGQPEARRTEPARRRIKKTDTNGQPALGLDLEESSPAESGVVERILTSDGATRLLVTAYIGIGNRLFIRGEGPGLSWDKGVPLQFVSIGKWRWETNGASAPVQFKLFKNDDQECTTLGAQTLDPGHQQEVTAAF